MKTWTKSVTKILKPKGSVGPKSQTSPARGYDDEAESSEEDMPPPTVSQKQTSRDLPDQELGKNVQDFAYLKGLISATTIDETARPVTQATWTDAVCSTCERISQKLFKMAFVSRAGGLQWNIDDVRTNKHCPLCRLVWHCIHSSLTDNAIQSLRGFVVGKVVDFGVDTHQTMHGQRLELYVSKTEQPLTGSNAEVKSRLQVLDFCVQPTVHGEAAELAVLGFLDIEDVCKARAINPNGFNLPLVLKWLSLCETSHNCVVSRPMTPAQSLDFDFRLLDVEKSCIIQAPPGCRYIALSYVWGGIKQLGLTRANQSALQRPGELRKRASEIPRTVMDAIEFCQKIKERYIWIDTLCILQDTTEDRHQQIMHMDAVYKQATLTIVAAAGTDCRYGLRGMQERPVINHCEVVNGSWLRLTRRSVMSDLLRSTWNQRAWTLQENVFSCRILAFTKTQVFFCCPKTLYREDTCLEYNHNTISVIERSLLPTRLREESYKLMSESQVYTRAYLPLAQSYVKRDLTKQEDMLDAFAGVTRALTPHVGPFLWGLPINFFFTSFFWTSSQPAAKMIRREGFPSWSWTGWIWGLDAELKLDQYKTTWDKISFLDETMALAHIVKAPAQLSQVLDGARLYHENDKALMTAFNKQTRFARQLKRGDSSPTAATSMLQSGRLLLVHEEVAMLKVTPSINVGGEGKFDAGGFLFDDWNDYICNFPWREGRPSRIELVRITDIQKGGGLGQRALLIETVSGVSYRVGLVQINWVAWYASNPQRRLIVLG